MVKLSGERNVISQNEVELCYQVSSVGTPSSTGVSFSSDASLEILFQKQYQNSNICSCAHNASITYAYDEPLKIGSYLFRSIDANNFKDTAPIKWRLEGRNGSASNWTIIDSQELSVSYWEQVGRPAFDENKPLAFLKMLAIVSTSFFHTRRLLLTLRKLACNWCTSLRSKIQAVAR